MTDNEIIKALERFQDRILKTNLSYYIFHEEKMAVCESLDLINRQTAEIEGLKDTNEHLAVFLEEAKTEAIKEFAERLHEALYSFPTVYNSAFGRLIDKIAKEFTEKGIS